MLELGDIRVHALDDGSFALDGGAMFGIVPRPLWQKKIAPDDRNRIPMAARCMLLEIGSRRVLVDTGMGQRWTAKEANIFDVDPEREGLLGALAKLGWSRHDITDVVLTHLHFDHAGGAVLLQDGELTVTFDQATHHLQRRHFKWAEHASEKDAGSFQLDAIELLSRGGHLHLLDGETEILEGVQVMLSEGHTVGQQLVRVNGGGQTLLFCADVIPTSAHVRVPWVMGYDLYPLTTIEEKKAILAQAIEEDWILFFEHDPQVAACRLREQDGQVVMAHPVEI